MLTNIYKPKAQISQEMSPDADTIYKQSHSN